MSSDPVLTAHQVATELGRDYRTIRRYLHDPHSGLHGTKRGNRWYIRRSALEAFLNPDADARHDVA